MSSEQDWTLEKEGKVARLLAELAKCEVASECQPIVAQLAECTSLDFGDNTGKWLAWYLEDHMGMRNALGILSGRRGQAAADDAGHQMLLDEDVFDRAEYNWCALERIKNKDDMQKLRSLYSDLESPILIDSEGPLSFRRLTAADNEDISYFRGKCLTEAIMDDRVQVRHLRLLKDYGKMMMVPLFPSPTQRAGAIVYASAISRALVRFDAKITSLSYKDLGESLPGLLSRPYLVGSYVTLFQEALQKCN